MRNFEIPYASDRIGEADAEKKKRNFVDPDRAFEQRRKLSKQEKPEDVERGLENVDQYQPDTQKIDPDRIVAAQRKKEEETKNARIAREQKIKAEDQKKIEEIRKELGLHGISEEQKSATKSTHILEGDGWHEVPTPPPLEGSGWHEVKTPPPVSPERAGKNSLP